MSKSQYAECSRSVSEGDLAGIEKKKQRHFEDNETFANNEGKQVFFTLPRWMSGRKKRSKIKYVKIDVPFLSREEKLDLENKNASKPKEERPSTFIRKLFRSNSFFNSKNSHKLAPKVPTSPTLFSSNSDVRSNSAFNFHSFDCHEYFKDKCPAVCGIKNHGNTCFMNAVIQCLSNTDTFAEYFVMDHFKMDLARRNKKHSKRYGTKGEVTEQLGALLKSLWSCQYYANVSSKFKGLVAKYGSQYEGNDQHDAQEFLLWLLDKVHEDLNIASKEKYKKTKGTHGRTDEDIAAEMLANHLRCNSSFIHDLLQGQIRSSLCCMGCGRFSNTFDPYLCISLPIPQTHNVPVILNLVFLKEKVKMTKVGVSIDSQATVGDLREKLNSSFGTSKDNLLLLEIVDGKFKRTFTSSHSISNFQDSQGLYAIETPTKSKNVSMESENIMLIAINKVETEEEYKMIWRPFVIEISRETSYEELKNVIFEKMGPIFIDNSEKDLSELFSLCVVDGELVYDSICSSVDMPLYMPDIDKALLHCHCNISHVKIFINWKESSNELLQTELEFVEEHPSVSALLNSKKQSTDTVTLQQCFELYFNEEKLGNEDAWMCSYCRHRLPCVKTLSLWSIPDVFIVHLKRFRQSSSQRTKITKFVEFPYTALDMNPYVATRNPNAQQIHNQTLASLAFWSPWKRARCHSYNRIDDNIYELYAVCNHHGSMHGGHYTAHCRNPISGHWYHFDDTKVQEVQASEVVSPDAYILFYSRSSLVSHSCASSSSGYSSASSTYSVGPIDHWAFHMASFFRDFNITSKSSDSLYDVGKTSSLDRRSLSSRRAFDRSFKTYSTMYHSNGNKTSSLKQNSMENGHCSQDSKPIAEVPPPPPPATRHYWTVTSV